MTVTAFKLYFSASNRTTFTAVSTYLVADTEHGAYFTRGLLQRRTHVVRVDGHVKSPSGGSLASERFVNRGGLAPVEYEEEKNDR